MHPPIVVGNPAGRQSLPAPKATSAVDPVRGFRMAAAVVKFAVLAWGHGYALVMTLTVASIRMSSSSGTAPARTRTARLFSAAVAI
ncbi:hypothetical protein MMAGJ_73770 [Mycolicibacterium mageritense]|uniref:Uncharacterized protein n=1 Tax=Mycolicibacterium mageritense TaxID=53462 RepID=A0AAI8U1D1_MYCME|nr:hypothetical protein MMAGJ_73770 [Mycolicibacterium mageritense]BDY32731.1 hypothetical protein hbim_06701 [Mycolicibacterium mageritense]CDO27170.1 hypothetical protein BN978_07735 [Mycolicibacterium mageritense DSM 44476 = CIP 104973]